MKYLFIIFLLIATASSPCMAQVTDKDLQIEELQTQLLASRLNALKLQSDVEQKQKAIDEANVIKEIAVRQAVADANARVEALNARISTNESISDESSF